MVSPINTARTSVVSELHNFPKKILFRKVLLTRANYNAVLLVLNCPETSFLGKLRAQFVNRLIV